MEQGHKVDGIKEKAIFFKNNKINAYIKDVYDNFYFCNILEVSDIEIKIYNFSGKRIGSEDNILLIDIIPDSFKKYEKREII